MKLRQARKIGRRAMWGRKADDYFNRIKQTTYEKALDCGYQIVRRAIRANRKRRKEVGE
jgi:hypothetical protein